MPRRRPAVPSTTSTPAATGATGATKTAVALPSLPASDTRAPPANHSASSSSSSSSSASVTPSLALIPVLGSSTAKPAKTGIVRPTAITKHGIRQFVETKHAVRLFLQNCVGSVNLNCQLELSRIATRARNAEYNPSRFPAVVLRLAEPKASALIFRTGKLVVTGTKNEDDTCFAARKVAKLLKRLDFDTKFINFGIQNIVGTGDVGFPVRLEGIAQEHAPFCSYEPELFPGLIYRMQVPRVVILIFVSGKIVLTGAKARSQLVQAAELIHPVLVTFSKQQVGFGASTGAAVAAAQSSSASSASASSASSSSSAAVVPSVRATARMPPRVATATTTAAGVGSARKGIPRVASKSATSSKAAETSSSSKQAKTAAPAAGKKRSTAIRIPARRH